MLEEDDGQTNNCLGLSMTRVAKRKHRADDIPLPHMTSLLWMMTPHQNGDGRRKEGRVSNEEEGQRVLDHPGPS